MKYFLRLLLFVVSCVLWTSCVRQDPIYDHWIFTSPAIASQVTIPVINDTNNHDSICTASISYNFDSLVYASVAGESAIAAADTVMITSCLLTIQDLDTANNFDNFNDLAVSLSTDHQPAGTIIAQINNNPVGYNDSLLIPATNKLIKSYLAPGSNRVNYTISGKLRNATSKTIRVNILTRYRIRFQ